MLQNNQNRLNDIIKLENLVEKGEVDRYVTCLLSPRDYFREDAPMEKYDYKISYEELLEWFEKQNDSKRMRVKQMVLENGIRRAKTGYVQPTDEKTDNFYKYYEKIGRENNPELGIRLQNNMHQIIHGSVSNQVYFIQHQNYA